MPTTVLIDHFEGDPDELYAVCQEEISQYDIPDLEYDSGEERRRKLGGGFLPKFEDATTLVVKEKEHKVIIIAYCYGSNFYVSLRTGFLASLDAKSKQDKHQWEYLDDVRGICFDELVRRGFQKALSRYLEEKQKPVPEELKPENVFLVEEESSPSA